MSIEYIIIISILILLVAFLYSSVGHAGASGYIAVMTLFNLGQESIKPIALILNIVVSIIASYQFYKAKHFSWSLFWPFAILSIPFAFLGGYIALPAYYFKLVIGVVLIFSGIRFLFPEKSESDANPPKKMLAIPIGASLGLLAGMSGTGGGIFLTPILLLKHWATTKKAAATSALFILLNSVSGLLGNLTRTKYIPGFAAAFLIAALLGGAAGSFFGSRKFAHTTIKRMLAVVLLIAGCKLIFAN